MPSLLCQRQRLLERMKIESQVGPVVAHGAPVDSGVRLATLADAQSTASGHLNSPARSDDVLVDVLVDFGGDDAAPDYRAVSVPPPDRTVDADVDVRDEDGAAAAHFQGDVTATVHQHHELARLADDRRPTTPPPRGRLGPGRTVAEVARLLRRRLRGPDFSDVLLPVGVGCGSGNAVRIGNSRDRERRHLLLAAHLSLLNSATARRRTLFITHTPIFICQMAGCQEGQTPVKAGSPHKAYNNRFYSDAVRPRK